MNWLRSFSPLTGVTSTNALLLSEMRRAFLRQWSSMMRGLLNFWPEYHRSFMLDEGLRNGLRKTAAFHQLVPPIVAWFSSWSR